MNLLAKLRGRTLAELGERTSQRLSSWLERYGVGDVGEPTGEWLRSLIGKDASHPVIRGPFYAAFDDRHATLQALRSVDPGFEGRLRESAARILAGRYRLLGHDALDLGEPVDWRLDPLAAVRAPERHWSEIDFLDPAVVGDHKLVWELGRHRAVLILAQAWWCTGDQRFAEGCARLLTSWLDTNPPKRGVHWASSLEVAFRSIAWVWILALAGDVLDPGLLRRLMGHLVIGGRHIERHLSTWFSPNTHLTGEALALFMLGTALPQLPEANRWRDRGAAILLEWLPRHVRNDGSYVEQSTWYHRYTTDFYLHFLILGERAGRPLRDQVAGPLERLLELLAWIARPDGTMPLIGDDDGGRLLFLDDRTAHDTRTPLASGAALFGRDDFTFLAGPPPAELVWLLGPAGLEAYRQLVPRRPVPASRAFTDGGVHVIRSGWDKAASVVTIDAGPHGFLNAGHAHADALSLDITMDGRPVFVDPGTFTYTTSPEWRDHFRESAWHNAATVDGCGSASVAGPFQWASRVTARADLWYDAGDVVFFSGTHDGFERLAPPVQYRRTVVFVGPSLWIVRDEIQGEGDHELAVHWQCAIGLTCEVVDGEVRMHRHGTAVAALRAVEAAQWTAREGWVSPTYGVREAAPHLTCVSRGSGVSCLTTVIAAGDTRATTHADDRSPAIIEVAWGDRRGTLLIGAGRAAGVDTDARLTWLELDDAGRVIAVTAVGATRLSVAGAAMDAQPGGLRWRSAGAGGSRT